ncbi:hypothetical protein HDV00_010827 [Rhizophlyctis rosea]|nr:hypothetical protein HDV00_010827 [Rhizophlyctis rosea]
MPPKGPNARPARMSREQRAAICQNTRSRFKSLLEDPQYTDALIASARQTQMFRTLEPIARPDAAPPPSASAIPTEAATSPSIQDASSSISTSPDLTTSTSQTPSIPTLSPPPPPISPRIFAGDTLDIAIHLKRKEGLNPLILNMASQFKPGGGWQNGSAAQEEQLFYRTTYDLALSDPFKLDTTRRWRYPMPVAGGIYTPNVLVIRHNEGTGFRVMDPHNRVFLDFVAVAALKGPKLDQYARYCDRDRQIMAEKIRAMLRIGIITGHRDLLLGAFGCGAYGNPAPEVAMLFKQVLGEEEFAGWFDHVDFAILDTRGEGNLIRFRNGIRSSFDPDTETRVLEMYVGETEVERNTLGFMLSVAAGKGFEDVTRLILATGDADVAMRSKALGQ